MLDLAFDDSSLYAMREAVEAHASQAGMPDGRIGDLAITVHELATNTIRHGAGSGRLRLWTDADGLHCQITEEGAAKRTPPAAQDVDAGENAADGWPFRTGRGLWLVRHMADHLELRSDPSGTNATVLFRLPPTPPRPSAGLTTETTGGGVAVRVTGHLDHETATLMTTTITATLKDRPCSSLTLDLTGMTYWDSAGIAALITAQQHTDSHPTATMTITGATPSFQQRLQALSFTRFTFTD